VSSGVDRECRLMTQWNAEAEAEMLEHCAMRVITRSRYGNGYRVCRGRCEVGANI
jgi:hypothetical protein